MYTLHIEYSIKKFFTLFEIADRLRAQTRSIQRPTQLPRAGKTCRHNVSLEKTKPTIRYQYHHSNVSFVMFKAVLPPHPKSASAGSPVTETRGKRVKETPCP